MLKMPSCMHTSPNDVVRRHATSIVHADRTSESLQTSCVVLDARRLWSNVQHTRWSSGRRAPRNQVLADVLAIVLEIGW